MILDGIKANFFSDWLWRRQGHEVDFVMQRKRGNNIEQQVIPIATRLLKGKR